MKWSILTILCLFLLSGTSNAAQQQQYTLFNDPYGNFSERYILISELKRLIENTPRGETIHGAIFSWSKSQRGCEVFETLKSAIKKGVNVTIVIDGKFSRSSSQPSSPVIALIHNNTAENDKELEMVCGKEVPKSVYAFQDIVTDFFAQYDNASIHLCQPTGGCISSTNNSKQHEKFWLFSKTTNREEQAINNVVYVSSGNLTSGAGYQQTNDALVIAEDEAFYNAFVAHFNLKRNQQHFSDNDYYTQGGYFQSNQGDEKTYNTVFWSPRGNGKTNIWTLRLRKISGDSDNCKLYINNAWHQVVEIAHELTRISNAGCDVKLISSHQENPPSDAKEFLSVLKSSSNKIDTKFINFGLNTVSKCQAITDEDERETCFSACVYTHHKYVVFQGKYNGKNTRRVWAGSFNFTKSANAKNDENMVKVSLAETVDNYFSNFATEMNMAQREGYNICKSANPSS